MSEDRIVARRREGEDYKPVETTVEGLMTGDRVVFKEHGELTFYARDNLAGVRVFAREKDRNVVQMLEFKSNKLTGSPEGHACYQDASSPNTRSVKSGELGYKAVKRVLGVDHE
jgi:hypothetical protein